MHSTQYKYDDAHHRYSERQSLLGSGDINGHLSASGRGIGQPLSWTLKLAMPCLFLLTVATITFNTWLVNDLWRHNRYLGSYQSVGSDGVGILYHTEANSDSGSGSGEIALTPSPPPSSSPWALSLSPYWKPLPEYRALLPSLCGSWMAPYQRLHAKVSSGDYFIEEFERTGAVPPPPVIAFRIDPTRTTGGISDRWPILASAMIVAVLTNRMIYFDWPGYQAAYTHPNLPHMSNTTIQHVYSQWRYYVDLADELTTIRNENLNNASHRSYTPRSYPRAPLLNEHQASLVKIDPAHVLHSKTHDIALLFEDNARANTDVIAIRSLDHLRELYGSDRPIVYFTAALGGKGLTKYFFDNPHTGAALRELGLKNALCHGCMINFVLGLNERVQSMFEPYARQLLNPSALTIGLQFRMGDAAMKGLETLTEKQKKDLEWQSDPKQIHSLVSNWFHCAQQLIDVTLVHSRQKIILFIVSDDVRLRRYLTTEFRHPGSNVTLMMIPTEGEGAFSIGHTDIGDRSIFDETKSLLKVSQVDRYLQVAAGEQWLLAYCDYLVIDQNASGFGRSAALRALRLRNAFDGRHVKTCDDHQHHLTVENWVQIGHKY